MTTPTPTLTEAIMAALVEAECTIRDPQATAAEIAAVTSRAAAAWFEADVVRRRARD